MFEVGGDKLTLRFNKKKILTVEAMLNISVMNELRNTQGMLGIRILETLFAAGLFNETTQTAVNGKKASEIFDNLLEAEGYSVLAEAVVVKLQEDAGFLFR